MNKIYKLLAYILFSNAACSAATFFITRRTYKKRMQTELDQMGEYSSECLKYAEEMKKYASDMYELHYGKEAPKEIGFKDMVKFLKENATDIKDKKVAENSYFNDSENAHGKDIPIKSRDTNINRLKGVSSIDDIVESYTDVQEAIQEKELETGLTDIHKAMTDYTKFSENPEKYEHPSEEIGMPAFEIITGFEYSYDKSDYTKEYLTYYPEDDIVADENGVWIDNPEELIGEKVLLTFDSPDNEEPNIVYVRNNRRGIDYEIERRFGHYEV